MLRDIDLSEISDGKLYTGNDLAKTDCQGCTGCSDCCRDMGSSIVLDPWDIYNLTAHLNVTFEILLQNEIELNVVDGIILPNLKMQESSKACSFLNEEGRCSIHAARPGFCRLFPLGRIYEEETFHYFLQIHECKKANKSKVKIKKWLGIQNLRQYEAYVQDWHNYLKERQIIAMDPASDASIVKRLSMEILQNFYLKPYEPEDFFGQFYERI